MNPEEVVDNIQRLNAHCFSILQLFYNAGVKRVDSLVDAGLISAIAAPWSYPSLVESSPYPSMTDVVFPNSSSIVSYPPCNLLYCVTTFFLNICCSHTPPRRSLRLRTSVAEAVVPLLMVLSDERHLIGGDRKSWLTLRGLATKMVSNAVMSTERIPPKATEILLVHNRVLRKRIFRLMAYDMFGSDRSCRRPCSLILSELVEYALHHPSIGKEMVEDFLLTEIKVQLVTITGLKGASELNGLVGIVCNSGQLNETSGRIAVSLQYPEERNVGIKPVNMTRRNEENGGGGGGGGGEGGGGGGEETFEWSELGASIPVHGTMSQYWCAFLQQCVLKDEINIGTMDSCINIDTLEYIAMGLYATQGMSKGKWSQYFAGDSTTFGLLFETIDIELQRHTSRPEILCMMLSMMKTYMLSEAQNEMEMSGMRDVTIHLFVENQGLSMLSRIMTSFCTKKNLLLKEMCETILSMICHNAHGKKTKVVLTKDIVREAKNILLAGGDDYYYEKKTTKKIKKKKGQKKKKKVVASPKTPAELRSDRHLSVFWERIVALEAQSTMSAQLASLTTPQKKEKHDDNSNNNKKHTAGTLGGICGGCHTEFTGKLLQCGKCQLTYCSRACQKKDWKHGDHKKVCQHRQKERKDTLKHVGKHNDKIFNKIEKFHKKQSEAANNMLYFRMKDICSIANFREDVDPASNNMVIILELVRGFVTAMTPDEAIEQYVNGDQRTISIIRRNQQPSSKLTSACCVLPAHSKAEESQTMVLKSIPKSKVMQAMALTGSEMYRSQMEMLRETLGMSILEFLQACGERGVSSLLDSAGV